MISFNEFNWLAVVLGSLAYYILGALWFTPLFGKQYDIATGVNRPRGKKWPALYYYGPLLGCILGTLSLSLLFDALSVGSMTNALFLALTIGVGFSYAVSLTNAITPNMPRPILFSLITGSYHVTGLCIAATILHALS